MTRAELAIAINEAEAQANAHAKRARDYRAPDHQAFVQPMLAVASELRALRLTIDLVTRRGES